MTQPTSIAAWHHIQRQLPAARGRVYDILARAPDATAADVEGHLGGNKHAHKRIPELVAQGVVVVTGQRISSGTREGGMTYRIVDPSIAVVRPLPKGSAKDVVRANERAFLSAFQTWCASQSSSDWLAVQMTWVILGRAP